MVSFLPAVTAFPGLPLPLPSGVSCKTTEDVRREVLERCVYGRRDEVAHEFRHIYALSNPEYCALATNHVVVFFPRGSKVNFNQGDRSCELDLSYVLEKIAFGEDETVAVRTFKERGDHGKVFLKVYHLHLPPAVAPASNPEGRVLVLTAKPLEERANRHCVEEIMAQRQVFFVKRSQLEDMCQRCLPDCTAR